MTLRSGVNKSCVQQTQFGHCYACRIIIRRLCHIMWSRKWPNLPPLQNGFSEIMDSLYSYLHSYLMTSVSESWQLVSAFYDEQMVCTLWVTLIMLQSMMPLF
jgi:hypothetical protein